MGLVDDKVFVRRANVLLEVSQETLEKYLNDGYDLVDKSGKLIREGAPNDDFALKRAYDRQKSEIEKLKAEVENLEKALEAVQNKGAEEVPRKTSRK